MDSFLQSIIQGQPNQSSQTTLNQLPIMPAQTATPQSTFQNNFNQLEKILQKAKAVQNPVAYLQSQVQNHPLIKKVLELGKQYNGNYDAATEAIIKENNLNPIEVKQMLQQLGILNK